MEFFFSLFLALCRAFSMQIDGYKWAEAFLCVIIKHTKQFRIDNNTNAKLLEWWNCGIAYLHFVLLASSSSAHSVCELSTNKWNRAYGPSMVDTYVGMVKHAVAQYDWDWYQHNLYTIIQIGFVACVCTCDIWSIVFYYCLPNSSCFITYDCRITSFQMAHLSHWTISIVCTKRHLKAQLSSRYGPPFNCG